MNDLLQRYDEVTARPKRNAYIMGLAYAILCAILLHAREWSDKINMGEASLIGVNPSVRQMTPRTQMAHSL